MLTVEKIAFSLFSDVLFDFSIARTTFGPPDSFVAIQIRHQGMPVAIDTEFMQFRECGISSTTVYAFHEFISYPEEILVPVFPDGTPEDIKKV